MGEWAYTGKFFLHPLPPPLHLLKKSWVLYNYWVHSIPLVVCSRTSILTPEPNYNHVHACTCTYIIVARSLELGFSIQLLCTGIGSYTYTCTTCTSGYIFMYVHVHVGLWNQDLVCNCRYPTLMFFFADDIHVYTLYIQ